MTLETGARPGLYEIVELRGRGGMGAVYRARDTRLARGEDDLAAPAPQRLHASRHRLRRRHALPGWSTSRGRPDGSQVIVVGNDDRLRIFDLRTRNETVLEIEGWYYGEYPAWAADGQGFYIDGAPVARGRLRKGLLYTSREGELRSLRQNWNEWVTHRVPTSDGKGLAFASQLF